MARLGLSVLMLLIYALHQDVWLWGDARPLVLGFLPIGLAYHGLYCLAVAGLMWLLTRIAWPSHLEAAAAAPAVRGPGSAGDAGSGDPVR